MADDIPQQRISADEKSGNRDGKGRFGSGNTAGTGGEAGWLKRVRQDMRAGIPTAQATLLRVMNSVDDKAATAAAKTWLEFAMPKPRQTHRVEGKNGDALAMVSAEALVAFVTGKKEGS